MIAPNGPFPSEVADAPVAGREDGESMWVPGKRRRDVPPSVAFLRPEPPAVEEPVRRSLLSSRRFWLRVLFGLDVIGAGGPGVLLLAAPETASRWLFAGGLTPDAGTAVLGCVWAALGLLSIAGLFRPVTFSPVL
ncbi:MAG TPA: hypothetical protein VF170_09365, partial [Planctomycetaceae bacterium]